MVVDHFPIGTFLKDRLLRGLDMIGLTELKSDKIAACEAPRHDVPWMPAIQGTSGTAQ